ncbi:MAG: thiamine phosphate synthase [Geminicoccaceae bacterium]
MSRKRERARGTTPADDGPWLDAAEARPRLLLFAAAGRADIETMVATGAVGGLVVGEADAATRALAQRQRLPLLLHGTAAAARAAGTDGIHLDRPEQVAAARGELGREALIGASCGLSRHAAMVAGEAGADYVLFGSLGDAPDEHVAELVAWWNELFVLPCAAAGRFSSETVQALVARGADFIATDQANVELAQALVLPGTS